MCNDGCFGAWKPSVYGTYVLGTAVQLHGSIQQKTCQRECANPDDWLTVHRSITLVNFQIDAQNSLFIYIKYIY
jgi:hypothetical protein